MIIDKYFRRPLVWDYLIAATFAAVALLMLNRGIISLPKEEYVYGMISDLATVSLTMVGFILTLVTVLISFKSTNKVNPSALKPTDSTFDVFFASHFYFQTIKLLKNGIKSLTLTALTGYCLKLVVDHLYYKILFIFCFIGLIIILMTVGRCLLILTRIIKIQQS